MQTNPHSSLLQDEARIGIICGLLVVIGYINWALHRNDINGGHGSAVSLQSIVVGKRHCRVLAYHSGAAGIDIIGYLLVIITNY